jgi:hypothetical protein
VRRPLIKLTCGSAARIRQSAETLYSELDHEQ